jgi:methionyl-tRNA formyltransferase
MSTERWRIAVITTVTPIAEVLTEALQHMGHEPVAVIGARRRRPISASATDGFPELSDSSAPEGIDVLLARNRHSMEPLLRATGADLAVCWGFSWRIPQAALEVPRLGVINCHPALLPRHRGPIPVSWAFREGDNEYGLTWHRMDAQLDTGGILAQTTIPMEDEDFDYQTIGPRMIGSALGLLPRVLERVAAGDPGDPQSDERASWAGWFGEDYAIVDWTQPRRAIHNQVRAWAFAVQRDGIVGPVTELDGHRVRLLRTALSDPGEGARRIDAGDGPIWIVKSEPLD